MAVLVVVSHVTLVLAFGGVDSGALGDADVLVELHRLSLCVAAGWVVSWTGALVLPAVRLTVLLAEGNGAVSVFPLGNVEAGVEVDVSTRSVTGAVLAVVRAVFDVDLSVGVTLIRLLVATAEP